MTGATGFIGGSLSRRLVAEGWSVRLLVRDASKLPPALHDAEVVVGDLADPQALERAVADVEVIFHCAANVNTWDSDKAYYAANVTGANNLLDAIIEVKPPLERFVHLSTVDVYGFPQAPCDEECPTAVSGFGYGDTKLQGENLVRGLGDAHNIPYTILRPCNVFGPESQFIRLIGKELMSGVMIRIDGGRSNAGLLYIDNLIDYMLWAARAQNAIRQCYNVRDSYDASWARFLEAFGKGLGKRGFIVNLPFGAADAIAKGSRALHRTVLPTREPLLHPLLVRIFGRTCGHSAAKIRAASAMESRIGFDQAMQKSVEWFRTNESACPLRKKRRACVWPGRRTESTRLASR